MKLSTKGRYGLRAMIDLAEFSEAEPVSIASISQRQGISERYLEQLMAKLKKAGLVESIRGARRMISSMEMPERSRLETFCGREEAMHGRCRHCAAFHADESCQAQDICATKYVWQKINESIRTTVDGIYLDQLVEESRKNKARCRKEIQPEALCGSSRKEKRKEEDNE